jgi:hypothetical protein
LEAIWPNPENVSRVLPYLTRKHFAADTHLIRQGDAANALFFLEKTLRVDGATANILIAIALAATVGGRPLTWGASFAAFHALYGIIGMLVVGEITTYSSVLGEVFILFGSLVLLRHFMHHSLHHQVGDDCSCENHRPIPVSTRAIVSTASAFSLHSLASGAILRGIAGDLSPALLMTLIVALSLIVGALIGAIVLVGNLERTPILRALDSLPGVAAALLTLLCCFSLFHLTHDFYPLSSTLEGVFLCASLALASWMGYRVHRHRTAHAANSGHHHHHHH